MPLNEMSDSLKARLYDMRYSPFLISFFISFTIYNYRFLMILFADNIDLDIKFNKLDKEGIGIIDVLIPFGTAIFYTGIYPVFGNWLYEVTLKYKNDAKRRKVRAESLTIKTQEEFEILEKENNKLVWDLEEKEKALSTYRKLYEDKTKKFDETVEAEKKIIQNKCDQDKKILKDQIDVIEQNLGNLHTEKENALREEVKTRDELKNVLEENKSLKNIIKGLKEKSSYIENLESENIKLKDDLKKLNIELDQVEKNNFDIENISSSYRNRFTDDEIEILHTIYTNDIAEHMSRQGLADELKKYIDEPRIKILNIINSLHSKDIVKTFTNGNYYISKEGKQDMVNMFDSEN